MDLIDRQAAVDILEVAINDDWDFDYAKDRMIELSTQPEIIRCRDCVYSHMTYNTYIGECKYCDMWRQIYESGESLYLEGDFFCGFGERKTDG